MIVIKTPHLNCGYEDIETAKADFNTWECGDFDEAMKDETSGFSFFEVDIDELADFDSDAMSSIFGEHGRVKLEGLPSSLESKLKSLMLNLDSFNELYGEVESCFDSPLFRAYMALVNAERLGNTNLRRKNINGFNAHNNGKFIFNAEGSHGEHVILEPNSDSLKQFVKMGIEHPCRNEIKKELANGYKLAIIEEQRLCGKLELALSEMDRKIEALSAELKNLRQARREQAGELAKFKVLEEQNVEVLKNNLSIRLKELGL
ncbi:hypothetical protein [Pseudoalteromonas luteoviolacea]|uniref:Uncharacterized protein n=1 Tax=Pseudoalteromonas luteoviolacea S4060-1 TaxID=1365257 RepID=A0A167KVE9_9GAMM|nr:hypothetical protein [Pseudoalteromonas luteoviolacea]KZN63344.1 hypothetical protein N478_03580 [Pseudoalteromonas luteoviolacea S4060-1]